MQPGVQTLTASHILSTLRSLPASLTSLTISHATVVEPDQIIQCPLQHLTTISLDFANLSYATLKWFASKSISNRTLKHLKVWVTSNITGDNLVDFMDLCGEDLRELVYKPQNPEPTKFPALRLIRCVALAYDPSKAYSLRLIFTVALRILNVSPSGTKQQITTFTRAFPVPSLISVSPSPKITSTLVYPTWQP